MSWVEEFLTANPVWVCLMHGACVFYEDSWHLFGIYLCYWRRGAKRPKLLAFNLTIIGQKSETHTQKLNITQTDIWNISEIPLQWIRTLWGNCLQSTHTHTTDLWVCSASPGTEHPKIIQSNYWHVSRTLLFLDRVTTSVEVHKPPSHCVDIINRDVSMLQPGRNP